VLAVIVDDTSEASVISDDGYLDNSCISSNRNAISADLQIPIASSIDVTLLPTAFPMISENENENEQNLGLIDPSNGSVQSRTATSDMSVRLGAVEVPIASTVDFSM